MNTNDLLDHRTRSQRLADAVTQFSGSWSFIGWFTLPKGRVPARIKTLGREITDVVMIDEAPRSRGFAVAELKKLFINAFIRGR